MQDCTSDDLATFSCKPGILGGDFTIISEFNCANVSLYTADYWPFLCVHISNSPYLGLYYSSVAGIKDLATFNARKGHFTDDTFTSFRDLGFRTLEFAGDENNVRLYKNGYPVEQLYADDVRGFLSLPQQGPGGSCLWTSPLQFQNDFESTCELTPGQDLCQESSVLSARMFLQGSSVSYPACPDPPKVVSKYRSSKTAPTNVVYYCTDDVSLYRVSDSASTVHQNKPSLFSRANDGQDSVSKYPQCSWDDGYTRPPVPLYDNVTQVCHNAILDVHYRLLWRAGEIISVEATMLLGSIGLPQKIVVKDTEETDIDFVPPPPITAPPTTEESREGMMTSIIFENKTEIITNVTDLFETVTFNFTLGTEETPGTSTTTLTITKPVEEETTSPTTTPGESTNTPAVPSKFASATPSPLPTPPVTTSPPPRGDSRGRGDTDTVTISATTILPTSSPFMHQMGSTDPAAFIQYFTATFIHFPETTYDPDTGHKLDPGIQSERSGNPGYIIGSPVLTGVALYDHLPEFECPGQVTDNCTSPSSVSGTNGTFIAVDDAEDKRLKVWGTGKENLLLHICQFCRHRVTSL